MNITLLIDSLGFGGAQRQIVNLAMGLKNAGYNVSLICYRRDNFYLSILKETGVAPVQIEEKNLFFRMLKIKKTIEMQKPDIVVSYMDAPNFYACISKSAKSRWNLITSERISNPMRFTSKQGKLIKRMIAKRSDAICCNSISSKNLWAKYYPETKDKLITIYNIVEISQLPTSFSNDEKCRVIVAARYEPEKNLLGMIQAVDMLSFDEKAKLEIHWYGKSNCSIDKESQLDKGKKLTKKYGLDKCIFLHEATDEIHEIMSRMDFVGLFSFMEGLPNSILEGMELKKPIIMSNVSDYDVLVDNSNGFCCDPNSIQSIADALSKAIDTTCLQRKNMGQKSYEKIQKICSRDSVMKQWKKLILDLKGN